MAVMTPTTLTNLVIYTVIPTGLGFLFWYAFRLKKELCAASGAPRALSSGKTLEMLVLEAEAEARECTKAGGVSLQKTMPTDERTFATLDEAYQQALHDVLYFPEYESDPRGLRVRERLGYKFTVRQPSMATPIQTADPERNKVIAAYTQAEMELFAKQTRSADEMAKAASYWKTIENPDGTINSNYGHLTQGRRICGNEAFSSTIRTPWEWAIATLLKDKDSRQAILHFNTPDHLWDGNRDIPCTTILQFFIRDDRLHIIVDMRSNDSIWGLPYNAYFFTTLLHRALRELHPHYHGLQLGSYTHFAHSLHIYERHFEMAERMLRPGLRKQTGSKT